LTDINFFEKKLAKDLVNSKKRRTFAPANKEERPSEADKESSLKHFLGN
jgi:hypothetical protein